jgi:hypothetical protein
MVLLLFLERLQQHLMRILMEREAERPDAFRFLLQPSGGSGFFCRFIHLICPSSSHE